MIEEKNDYKLPLPSANTQLTHRAGPVFCWYLLGVGDIGRPLARKTGYDH
ncbi:hypothetical protein [Entomobacter blattae]|nr:hypothetical protein [Entomobacter blattae]